MANPTDERDEHRTGSYTVYTERDDVRRWADDRGIIPASRQGAAQPEFVREAEMTAEHERHEWDDFFTQFEDRNLAVAHDEDTDEHRLVDRETVVDESGAVRDSVTEELLAGETVQTEVTEREVVETEIIEEATIESEVVGSEVVDEQVVGTEIVSEELVDVAVVDETDAEVVDGADRRSFEDDQRIEIAERGGVVLEIDERRTETVEQLEETIVESRVVDTDVEERTTETGESVDVDIDVAGIHEHIGESGIVDTGSDAIIDERHIETEFDEDDRATSTITERKTIERDIDERKVVLARIDEVTVEDSTVTSEMVVDSQVVESGTELMAGDRVAGATDDTTGGATDDTTGGVTDDTTGGVTDGTEPMTSEDVGRDEITDQLMGRDVETVDGDKIGMVSDVDSDQNRLYIEEDPSLTDKIKASLNWGEEEDASVLRSDQIRKVTRDAVVVDGTDAGTGAGADTY